MILTPLPMSSGSNESPGYLDVPELSAVVFPAAYKAGAKVHSNSWKDGVDTYNSFSYDVDDFSRKNDDFLVFFAAGNYGHYGAKTVKTPSNAKNCLSVGAMDVRDAYTDEVHAVGTVAYFSSIGPSNDGRMKPDIVTVGHYVLSAFAGPPGHLSSVLSTSSSSSSTSVQSTCAVISSSGTSMSTPIAAGVALLIRQFYYDSAFWAATCDTTQSMCAAGAFSPSGYLVKATILHSGRGLGRYSTSDFDYKTAIDSVALGAPPDEYQGYGAITLNNVLPLPNGLGLPAPLKLSVWDALVLPENKVYKWTISFQTSSSSSSSTLLSRPIKVTICWYDLPSKVGSVSNLLIHNLDLKIMSPSGTVYWGNGKQSADDVNPNEQITISDATECEAKDSCVYTVYVSAGVFAEADQQKFAIVFTTAGMFTTCPLV